MFCIGLNRTGSASLGAALRVLDYDVWSWNSNSADFTLRWHEGQFTPGMDEALANHSAFEDFPWPMLYRELDERAPEAKFILTVRKSPQKWLRSIQTRIGQSPPWVGHYLIYGSYSPKDDAAQYLRVYEEHNASVRQYFAGRPRKLLVMCLEDGDGWDKLCPFLGVDVPDAPFPKRQG